MASRCGTRARSSSPARRSLPAPSPCVRLRFQESTSAMRPEGNRGIEVSREVGERFGTGFDYMMLVLSGDTPGATVTLADRAAEGAEKLVDDGILYRLRRGHLADAAAARSRRGARLARRRAARRPATRARRGDLPRGAARPRGCVPSPSRRAWTCSGRRLPERPITADDLAAQRADAQAPRPLPAARRGRLAASSTSTRRRTLAPRSAARGAGRRRAPGARRRAHRDQRAQQRLRADVRRDAWSRGSSACRWWRCCSGSTSAVCATRCCR